MNRRGFLASMLALAAAPAIVRAQSLMPIRPLVRPTLAETMAIQGLTWSSTQFDPWMIVLYDAAGTAAEMPFDAQPLRNGDGIDIITNTRDLCWTPDHDAIVRRITCRLPDKLGGAEVPLPVGGYGPWPMAKGCNFHVSFPRNAVLTLTES